MEISVEFLEKCTLSQACEFLAFGFEPMLPIYEDMVGRNVSRAEMMSVDDYVNDFHNNYYDSKLFDAKAELTVALYQKLLTAKGIPDFENEIFEGSDILSKAEFAGKKLAYDYEKAINSSFQSKINITDIPANVYIDVNKNEITTKSLLYKEVEIDFSELQSLREELSESEPEKHKLKPELSYTTPYIDIMLEVIAEQKITEDNQGKKEQLKSEIMTKLTKHHLESGNLAGVMATLIRLPESQKGKAKKK
ncbi:MAG: hypothetical protein LBF37_02730 [Rickettsiales bacterium]|nr:hypothetical protein [Rickettsiales bacterium]